MEVSAEAEQPSAAWRLLNVRPTAAIAALLVAAGFAGWSFTIRQAADMTGMITGLGQVGTHMSNNMSSPAFMVTWLGMMVAMMLPTIAPVVLAQRMLADSRGEGAIVSVAFVAGYLAVWLFIGLIPLVAFLLFRSFPTEAHPPPWLPSIGGGVLIAAGLYQITPWKSNCLRACRSPLGFVSAHNAKGTKGALRAAVSYGAYCVGSCWAMMAVLVAVGLMNLVWMAAIGVLFLAEKNWRHGILVARMAGVALATLGTAVVAVPSVLMAISN